MGYFKKEDNLLVAYHIDDTEYLNMVTLSDSRVLYLCNNPTEWFPHHLIGGSKPRILKIKINNVESVQYKWREYFNLSVDLNESDGGELFEKSGAYFHYTTGEDKGEISEGFLIYPKKHVVSIEMVHDPMVHS